MPAAHKHGGKGATEARRFFGVELRTWKRENGNEKERRNVSAGRNSYFILRDFVSRTSPCLSAAGR